MKTQIITLISLFLVALSFNVSAADQFLCMTQNDKNPATITLSVRSNNDGQLTHIIEKIYDNEQKFLQDLPKKVETFSLKQLKKGVILYSKQGFDIIKLKLDNFTAKAGAYARLFYKSNVLTQRFWRKKRSRVIQLLTDGSGNWYTVDSNGARMNYTFFKTGKYGVKEVQFNYKAELDL